MLQPLFQSPFLRGMGSISIKMGWQKLGIPLVQGHVQNTIEGMKFCGSITFNYAEKNIMTLP